MGPLGLVPALVPPPFRHWRAHDDAWGTVCAADEAFDSFKMLVLYEYYESIKTIVSTSKRSVVRKTTSFLKASLLWWARGRERRRHTRISQVS